MPDPLADELRDLGRFLAIPEARDQRAAVRARLEARPRRRPRFSPPRRWVAAAAAVAAAVVVGVVPPARAAVTDAVGRVLRFAGVEIRDGDPGTLPASPSPLPAVRSVALDEARRVAKFPVLAPTALGVPEEVLTADPAPDGAPRVVTLLYRGGTVRIDQFDGRVEGAFLKKAADAESVQVRGDFGVWVPAPHPVVYVDRFGVVRSEAARLAGPTLIWASDSATYRVEGLTDLDSARAVAESMT
ncbi:hypothetical protein [Virgisporangium ochraceum]|uniref:DUF4367 domain-containing protein n=1 Tax=Virgisporangium ochraceum TaxID=65505 RepID=A0A8J4A185_9ACTN|nr:hypothetical protein [Virgisporangium ochraceum]GIJ72075.1 hypothetical protein Voc01_069920 [Virgisporangium ochraceum]